MTASENCVIPTYPQRMCSFLLTRIPTTNVFLRTRNKACVTFPARGVRPPIVVGNSTRCVCSRVVVAAGVVAGVTHGTRRALDVRGSHALRRDVEAFCAV